MLQCPFVPAAESIFAAYADFLDSAGWSVDKCEQGEMRSASPRRLTRPKIGRLTRLAKHEIGMAQLRGERNSINVQATSICRLGGFYNRLRQRLLRTLWWLF